MTTPFDTQKVKLDLLEELWQTRERAARETNMSVLMELAGKIRWLLGKLEFLESPEYKKRKQWMNQGE